MPVSSAAVMMSCSPPAAARSRSSSPGCRRRLRASSRARRTAGTSPTRNGDARHQPARDRPIERRRAGDARSRLPATSGRSRRNCLQRVGGDRADPPVAERPRPSPTAARSSRCRPTCHWSLPRASRGHTPRAGAPASGHQTGPALSGRALQFRHDGPPRFVLRFGEVVRVSADQLVEVVAIADLVALIVEVPRMRAGLPLRAVADLPDVVGLALTWHWASKERRPAAARGMNTRRPSRCYRADVLRSAGSCYQHGRRSGYCIAKR